MTWRSVETFKVYADVLWCDLKTTTLKYFFPTTSSHAVVCVVYRHLICSSHCEHWPSLQSLFHLLPMEIKTTGWEHKCDLKWICWINLVFWAKQFSTLPSPALPCPAGSHYEACGSACPASCADLESEAKCKDHCVEGCQCDKGLVLSGDR